ncbi:hypothetical protein DPSP01_010321 [Paraphaeosphaeria sporulosa]|uniref:SGNH hydrolase n=1 Tax=Paraphaeosphaeria sporulosa TaxID=1460663 RepID=A0A177CEG6_9PLEO|nr:uncharacterized protein CC84DRAFT_834466 [Paraphaeosphaeria sporulosa]OAG05302.1 hypothetical protein CC84DRAFT_834466 [Paraphaeosphaeria sporulosa]
MRFITRLHVCAAAALVTILYFSWRRPSTAYLKDNLQRVWKNSPRRVVVFGDDWSDTGEYRMFPPPKGSTRDRNAAQGDIWVETLCKELTCDWVDNFARSVPDNVGLEAVGSMVDSNIFLDVTSESRKETLAVFDFKTQVQHFIEFDKKKWRLPGRHTADEQTVFTVLFGTWDLLQFSPLDKDAAIRAIDRSVKELFHNLDILADHVGTLKVTVPNLMDVTFLPRYSDRKNESATEFAQDQHQAVFLWSYWNTALSQAASEWARGDVFVPNVHDIIMEEVRAKQMFTNRIADAKGNGRQEPLFEEVEKPCLVQDPNAQNLQAAAHPCTDPSTHLFWDDMHLSGPAHELIGKEAARLVRGNEAVNSDARQRAKLQSATDKKSEGDKGANFDLKFPPGY